MRINKIIKSIAVMCLMLILVLSLVGCNKPVVDPYKGNLEFQCKNDRYYFQQGYRGDWTANFMEDEYELDKKNLLLFEMWPTAAEGDAMYSIYTGDTKVLLTTVVETADKMLNPDTSLYFNSKFIKGEKPREGFEFTSAREHVIYNKLQYQRVKYSFTQDGVKWLGEFYVTMKSSKFYAITWERKEDVADTYQAQFLESISDYRFRGFEEE